VQQLDTFNGQRYGSPSGPTGGAVFNKTLFTQAGLPANWQPKTWNDIITAAQALKKLPGVTPIQLDAGTRWARPRPSRLPAHAGRCRRLAVTNGKWKGNTAAMRAALGFYQQIYAPGWAIRRSRRRQKGRDASFGRVRRQQDRIPRERLFWRAVLSPTVASTRWPIGTPVGWALIPAQRPGRTSGRSFVTYSGGGIRVSPHTKYPSRHGRLLTF